LIKAIYITHDVKCFTVENLLGLISSRAKQQKYPKPAIMEKSIRPLLYLAEEEKPSRIYD
jgi:hypothetical protein